MQNTHFWKRAGALIAVFALLLTSCNKTNETSATTATNETSGATATTANSDTNSTTTNSGTNETAGTTTESTTITGSSDTAEETDTSSEYDTVNAEMSDYLEIRIPSTVYVTKEESDAFTGRKR